MKIAIAAILVLSAVSAALAVTVTGYSDAACATLASNPVLGLANPSTANLNACAKSYTIDGVTYYIKFTSCSSSAVASIHYSDAACTKQTTVSVDVPDKCIVSDVPGLGSIKLSCSSSAVASLAFISVFAAALAVFL
jgi:hypothetical protein